MTRRQSIATLTRYAASRRWKFGEIAFFGETDQLFEQRGFPLEIIRRFIWRRGASVMVFSPPPVDAYRSVDSASSFPIPDKVYVSQSDRAIRFGDIAILRLDRNRAGAVH